MRQRVLRVLWRTVQAFLVLIVLAGIGLYFGRDELLRKAGKELEALGLPPIQLEVSEISFDRIGFSGVSIGDSVKVRDLKAGFAWREILTGKFDRITIENPELTVRQIDDRLDFGDLNPLIFAEEETTATETDLDLAAIQASLPFRHLILKNAIIFILSDQGTTELHFDADISSVGKDINIENARLLAEHEDLAEFTAEAFATISDNGDFKANLSNLYGSFDLGFAAGKANGGKGYVSGNLLALDTLQSSFELRLESASAPFGLTGAAELMAETTGTAGTFSIRANEQSTGASSALAISVDPVEDDHLIDVTLDFSAPDLTAASAPFLPDLPFTGRIDMSIDTSSRLSEIIAAGLLPTPWEQALAAAPIDLRLTGTALGLEVLPLGLDTTLALRLETDGNRKALRFLQPMTMMAEAGHTETELYDTILPYLDTRYDGPLQVDFGKAGDIVLWLRADTPDAVTAETDLQASFSGGGIAPASLLLQGDSTYTTGADDPLQINLYLLRLLVDEWQSSVAQVSGLDLSLNAEGRPFFLNGSSHVKARTALSLPAEDISADVGIDTVFDFAVNDNQLTFGIVDCGAVSVHTLDAASIGLLSTNNRFCLQTDQPVALDLSRPGSVAGRFVLALPENLLRIRVPDGQRVAVGGKNSSLRVRLSPAANDGALPDLSTTLALSSLYTTNPRLAAGQLSIDYDGDALATDGTVAVSVKRLESLENPAYFEPVGFESKTILNGNEISHSGSLGMVSDSARVEFEVTHDRDVQNGSGTIRPLPLQFGPDDVALEDVSPLAGSYFSQFTATVLGAASLDWNPDRFCVEGDAILQRFSVSPRLAVEAEAIRSDGGQLASRARVCQAPDGTQESKGELLIENLNIRFGALELLRMNTVLDLPEVVPAPKTAPDQPFSIAVANIGVPLTSGIGSLTIHSADALDISDFGFDWAGGKVSAGPVQVRDGTIAEGLQLRLAEIDLTELVGLLQLGEQLEAEGTIGGEMTVGFEDGQPGTVNGVLASQGPGTLRYLGGDLGADAASSLLSDALSNFQFDKVEVKVEGRVEEEAKITLHLVGKNPDLHDGHPLDLEVSVNGRLAALFKDSLGAYQVPTQIKERMFGYGQ